MTRKESPSLSPRSPGRREEWRRQENGSIRTVLDLDRALHGAGLDPARRRVIVEEAAAAIPSCSMRITPYYFGLIGEFSRKDPIFLQAVPTRGECERTPLDREDPVGDRRPENRPVEAVIHRYEDRALFLPTWRCAVHCRFCFRRGRERMERPGALSSKAMEEGIRYIADHSSLREVILSGGDPLTLSDDRLFDLLGRLAAPRHVKTLRIHTRFPAVNPFRVTGALCRGLARSGAPLWVVVHFNHPVELTAPAREALGRLVDSGIPLLSQTVLLRDVNDSAPVLEELFFGLIRARVKPYYLHHADRAPGAAHFRVPLSRGIALMRSLRGRVPGFALPHYVLDVPGGPGKVPLEHPWALRREDGSWRIETPGGRVVTYREH